MTDMENGKEVITAEDIRRFTKNAIDFTHITLDEEKRLTLFWKDDKIVGKQSWTSSIV